MNLLLRTAFLSLSGMALLLTTAAQPPGRDDSGRPDRRPPEQRERDRDDRDREPGRERSGPGGFGGPGGFAGRGGPPGGEQRKLLKEYDRDENGWLNREERAEARKAAQQQDEGQRRPGPFGRGGFRGEREPAKPGAQVRPEQVSSYPDAELYDNDVVRTLFFEFENEDWEQELEDFHNTDVDVPATMIVDGKRYANVGMRFRGMSSYGMVPAGYKRSFNVSVDLADDDQRLYGYRTLNLLNSHGDPTFLSTVLYSKIASAYIPVPQANHVHVVVNGESWGVYVNVQQFNKDFLAEHFESTKGTRWKVSGNPRADGGLRYLGDDLDEYKQRFEMKSNDGKKAWNRLVELCRTLNETPLEDLESALEPMLDIDSTLKFLALDVALVNSDGYWTRASDYSLFLDKDKRVHVIPHDMNEAFRSGRRGPGGPGGPGGRGFGPPPGGIGPPPGDGIGPPPGGFGFGGFRPGPGGPPPEQADRDRGGRRSAADGRDNRERGDRDRFDRERGDQPRGRDGRRGEGDRGARGGRGGFGGPPGGFGPGGPGGPGHGGVDLDPLVAIDDPRMPLRSRLLAVPSLKARYLQYVRQIAEESLDWDEVAPFVTQQAKLIQPYVAADTRRLTSLEDFEASTSANGQSAQNTDGEAAAEPDNSLRSFFEKRRAFLLEATKSK